MPMEKGSPCKDSKSWWTSKGCSKLMFLLEGSSHQWVHTLKRSLRGLPTCLSSTFPLSSPHRPPSPLCFLSQGPIHLLFGSSVTTQPRRELLDLGSDIVWKPLPSSSQSLHGILSTVWNNKTRKKRGSVVPWTPLFFNWALIFLNLFLVTRKQAT